MFSAESVATKSQAGGRSYFVTQDEPVNCWEWIGELLSVAKVPPPRRRVPLHVAYAAGAMLEAAYAMMKEKQNHR